MNTLKHSAGFSLIELLIVVALIGILTAIAAPNMIASRRAANEGSAISSLRTIHSAESTYRATAGDGEFGTLTNLGSEKLIDSLLSSGSKSGYTFACEDANLTAGPPPSYFATAIPSQTGSASRTGNRSFVITEDGILRGKITDVAAENHTAAADSATWPPLQN